MKLRLVVAVVMFAAVVMCAGLSYGYLERQSRGLETEIRTTLQPGEAPICPVALDICARWDRCKPLFCVLIHHNDADALSKSFFLLRQYATAGDTDRTRDALSDCLAELHVIMEGEKPKFTNIL